MLAGILDQVVNGIASGAIYVLVAGGLALLWSSMHVVNFAHGEFIMAAAYSTYFFVVYLRLPLVFAAVLTIAGVGLTGAVIERILIEPNLRHKHFEPIVLAMTVGLSFALQSAALSLFGPNSYAVNYYVAGSFSVGSVSVTNYSLLVVIVSAVAMALLWAFLRFSRLGMSIRATSQDRRGAELVGIRSTHVFRLVFAVSVALAAVAGVMLVPLQSAQPYMGTEYLLIAFVVVAVAGLGSLLGTLFTGLGLGIIQGLVTYWWGSQWSLVFASAILLVVLVLRPNGIFGFRGRTA